MERGAIAKYERLYAIGHSNIDATKHSGSEQFLRFGGRPRSHSCIKSSESIASIHQGLHAQALSARSWPFIRSSARPPTATRAASYPHPPAPSPALRELYISHTSTYGQRYLPSPPGPLSRTAGEGVNAPRSVLSRILPRWYANDRLLLPTRLLGNA